MAKDYVIALDLADTIDRRANVTGSYGNLTAPGDYNPLTITANPAWPIIGVSAVNPSSTPASPVFVPFLLAVGSGSLATPGTNMLTASCIWVGAGYQQVFELDRESPQFQLAAESGSVFKVIQRRR